MLCENCQHERDAHLDGWACMTDEGDEGFCPCAQFVTKTEAEVRRANAERKRGWEELRTKYREAIEAQFWARPDLHGKIFTRVNGHASASMAFSHTLLDIAGGIWDLERDWKADT